MKTVLRFLAVFALVAPHDPVRAQSASASSTLVGMIVTVDGVGIGAVEVALPADSVSTATDSAGRFSMKVSPGSHVVRVRRIGFRPQLLSLRIAAGETKSVLVTLERGIAELPEVAVTARQLKPIEYGFTTRYDGFFQRRAVGLGRFITRENIEKMKPFRTPNLLVGIAGVRLRFHSLEPTGTAVEFVRCGSVGVWIDGVRQTQPVAETSGRALGEFLQSVVPSQIELIEVYRGPAELPAEFHDNACAAIVIWTR